MIAKALGFGFCMERSERKVSADVLNHQRLAKMLGPKACFDISVLTDTTELILGMW